MSPAGWDSRTQIVGHRSPVSAWRRSTSVMEGMGFVRKACHKVRRLSELAGLGMVRVLALGVVQGLTNSLDEITSNLCDLLGGLDKEIVTWIVLTL